MYINFIIITQIVLQKQQKLNRMQTEELVRIIHFNDVYDIQPGDKDPIGGVSRFKTAIDDLKNEKSLVLFSGDAFSPSILSQIYKGQQMILPLNSFGIDVACLGNHDLDFGEDVSLKLQSQTNFPWVLSNFFYKGTTRRLLECKQYIILEKYGFKFGIFGLAEKQWIDTLDSYYHDKLDYVDFVEYGELMVHTLKEDYGCDFIIALTHMMGYNDTKLANSVVGIDLILGGHDHTIRSEQIKNIPVIKSGTNFKQLSVISIKKQKQNCHFHSENYGVDIQLIKITDNMKQNQELQKHVQKYMKDIEQDQNRIGMILEQDIDLRFETIRKTQSPYLRMITEWYHSVIPCDVALFNAGNLRNNAIFHKGPLLKKNIFNHCKDQTVAKKIKGSELLDVLQNSVSMYPNLSGRYSAFSGIRFTWDSQKPSGHRVIHDSVKITEKDFDMNHEYIVATHHFQAVGGDGFSGLREAEWCFKLDQPLMNVDIINTYINPENEESKQFARLNPEYYTIKEDEHGVKHVHFNPSKVPITVTMI